MVHAILLTVIASAVVIFSVQNAEDVNASFLLWQFDIALSTLMVSAVLAGIVVAQLLRQLIIKRREKEKHS